MTKSSYGAFDFREFTLQVILHQQAIADKLGINLTDFKIPRLAAPKGSDDAKRTSQRHENESGRDDDSDRQA